MTAPNVFPAGSLVRALFYRPLMILADRGGSSGTVGDRWGDHTARFLDHLVGSDLNLPDGRSGSVVRVVRLDTIPSINRFASRHSLSNPDFLIELDVADERVLAAADAKFSIETARSKQVSAEVVAALISAEGSPLRPIVDPGSALADGIFLSPDFQLTHEVLSGRFGIGRLSVRRPQVHLVPATSADLFDTEPIPDYIDAFGAIDGYRDRWRGDLMLGLYGLRCGAAAIGCWRDEVRPLLGAPDGHEAVPERVLDAIATRTRDARTGWELIQRWDAEAETVRAQRVAVSRAAQLPVPARDLRELVEHEAKRSGVAEPSLNYVRRQLANLTRDRLQEEFGVLNPPLDEHGRTLADISAAVARMSRSLPEDITAIVAASGRRSERPE